MGNKVERESLKEQENYQVKNDNINSNVKLDPQTLNAKDYTENTNKKDNILFDNPSNNNKNNNEIDENNLLNPTAINNNDKIETEFAVLLDPNKDNNKPKDKKNKTRQTIQNDVFVHKFPKNDTDLGYEDEIHNNHNFGKPVNTLGKIWLTYDFKAIADPVCPKLSINLIPKGWRLPTIEDFNELLSITKFEGFHNLTKKLKLNTSSIYITSTKTYPDKYLGNEEDSWIYKTILINENDFKIADTNLFKFKDSLLCKLVANEVIENMDYESPIVAIVNKEVIFKVPDLCNITTFEWNFDDGIVSKSKIFKHIFKNVREHKVTLNLILYGNRVFNLQKNIWVVNDFDYGEDEIINDIDYGPPVLIGQQVWMKYDMIKYTNFQSKIVGLGRGWGPGPNGENSYIDSVACCPPGWRLPTKADFEELLNCSGRNNLQRIQFLLLSEGFGAKLNDNGVNHYICFDLVDDLWITSQKYKKNNYSKEQENSNIPNMINFKDLNINNLDKHLNNKNFLNNIKYYDSKILSSFNYYDITRKSAYCLEINTNNAFISNRSTSTSSLTSFFSTRLIACDNFDVDIGIPEKDPVIYEYIQFKIKHPNLISCTWDFGDDTEIIKNEPQPKHKYDKEGKYEITVSMVFFGNREITTKKIIYIQGFLIGPTKFFGEDQILLEKLEYAHCQRIEAIHFVYASSTLVPSKDGGMYLVYHDLLDYKLKVVKINIRPSFEVKDYIFQIDYLTQLDAISTEKGISMLLSDIRDKDLLLLMQINEKGEILFKNIIMQNGSLPINAFKDQLIFFDPATTKPYHGINAMHMPKCGKLSYGKGKILVIFSYYNYFGYSKQGAREDNNGDSIIVFNEDGSDVHLASIWSTSHSLKQNTCYDGRYFYTASLGDALPQNIKIVRVDPMIQNVIDNYKNRTKVINSVRAVNYLDEEKKVKESNYQKFSIIHSLHNYRRNMNKSRADKEKISDLNSKNFNMEDKTENMDLIIPELKYQHYKDSKQYVCEANSYIQYDTVSTNLIDGCIPGDMIGQSSGRLGSLIHLGGANTAITYSRIPCTNHFGDSNNKSEFGALFFNSDLIPTKKIVFYETDDVNCIKSSRYGNNIFLMFSTTERRFGQFLSDYVTTDDKTYAFLIDSEGNVTSDCHEIKKCKFNPNDEIVTLKDGSIAWTYIDQSNIIKICVLYVEEKKSRFDIGQKEAARPRYKLNVKEQNKSDEIVYKKPKNDIIQYKKDKDKKYLCYVDKPEKIELKKKVDEIPLSEKLKKIENTSKVEIETKDILKVKEKKYDNLVEGRTFNVITEEKKKNYFKSLERKHNFIKKETQIKISEKLDDEFNKEPQKAKENKETKKSFFKSKIREYKFIKAVKNENRIDNHS